MEPQSLKFKELVELSERILITSHISPDPDAISSVLLLGTTLQLNYPNKQIKMVLEEEPDSLDFIHGYDQIQFTPITTALSDFKPDLFVLLDGNNYERCSRHDGQIVRDFISSSGTNTVIIDHHELAGADKVSVFINNHSPSTVQDVYSVCFGSLRLKKPDGYAQTTMTGLYADTGGFTYMKDGQHKGLFDLAEELVDAGANVELVKNNLSRYTIDDMRALGELISNIRQGQDYTFSYLPDEFITAWNESGKTLPMLQKATGSFLDNHIRSVEGRSWGFIVYRNALQGDDMYSVSLRASGNSKDVSAIAAKLGGGGHKPAAGAKFQASSVEEALKVVQKAISES
jgi:bifunctional oligoribonuclease and PAP phosphatase NrnA